MRETHSISPNLDHRIAEEIRRLRGTRGWSLDELAKRSGVSRATLSRLENAEVSPTASVLGKLCAAFEVAISRLMYLAERDFAPRLSRADQPVWHDRASGLQRRAVSPPTEALAGEVVELRLEPGARIDYPAPPRRGLEHHLVLLEGALRVSLEGHRHDLAPGDCLRYRLFGASRFETPAEQPARYLLFLM